MWILMIILWRIFGSLGSVVMTRFADGVTRTKLRGFFFGYSECPECKHRLVAKDLIPLISYFSLWGKCRYCGKRISRIYPFLELLCALAFLLTYALLKDFWTPILIFWLLTNRLLIIILTYDLQAFELHMISRTLLALVWILANICLAAWNLRYTFLSVLIFGGVFTWIYFFAKRYAKMRFKKNMEWFGEGDVYLAVVIWIFIPLIMSTSWIALSWWMLVNVLILFILLSSILGLLWSGLQFLLSWKFTKIIPFFPAMIIAFWLLAWKMAFFIHLLFPLAW